MAPEYAVSSHDLGRLREAMALDHEAYCRALRATRSVGPAHDTATDLAAQALRDMSAGEATEWLERRSWEPPAWQLDEIIGTLRWQAAANQG